MTTQSKNASGNSGSGYLSHRPLQIAMTPARAVGGVSDAFANYRPRRADIVALTRIVGGRSDALAEVLPILDCLTLRPPASFANLSDVYAAARRADQPPRPSTQAIRLLQRFFLDEVDRRLQFLYRQYLSSCTNAVDAPHDEKVCALEAVRNEAQAIVSSYAWHWLAEWLELELIGETAATCIRRLSNLAFKLARINFRLTYHCNISCRHCYNSSGPHMKSQRIPLDAMLEMVAQMPAAGIGHLNLTGGEPFLYRRDLLTLIAAGRSIGLHGISIYTNGYWARSDAETRRILEELAEAGLMQGRDDHLKVSTGLYHQEFVGIDRVMNVAREYHTMFGRRLKIDVEIDAAQRGAKDEVRELIRAAGLGDRVELFFRGVTPLGRAKQMGARKTQSVIPACDGIDQIVFDPGGYTRPCCGLNNENHGVVVGNMKSHSLLDLVKRMQNDPILQFVANNRMSDLFDHIEKPKMQDGYSGRCHLCQHALGDLRDKEELQAKLFDRQRFYPFWFSSTEPDRPISFPAEDEWSELD